MENEKALFGERLCEVFASLSLDDLLTPERIEAFYTLFCLLREENEKYNLTAVTDMEGVILLHFADSLMGVSLIPEGASVLDVGCGAGFPSLPLALVSPDLKITSMDSTAKRVNYVKETAEMLGLTNITAVTMRAEDGGKSPEYRERFDYATARAVAEMRVLAELTLPFVKVGGQLIAMKGKNAEFELSSARKAIATLGGRGTVCESITLRGEGDALTHPLIIIDKKERTPLNLPRPFAQISKKPL